MYDPYDKEYMINLGVIHKPRVQLRWGVSEMTILLHLFCKSIHEGEGGGKNPENLSTRFM